MPQAQSTCPLLALSPCSRSGQDLGHDPANRPRSACDHTCTKGKGTRTPCPVLGMLPSTAKVYENILFSDFRVVKGEMD